MECHAIWMDIGLCRRCDHQRCREFGFRIPVINPIDILMPKPDALVMRVVNRADLSYDVSAWGHDWVDVWAKRSLLECCYVASVFIHFELVL